MIKAIIFDCFGVLTVDLWKEFVATLPEVQRQPARDINHAYDAGFINEKKFMEQVRDLTGKSPGEVEKVRNSDGTKNEELLAYIAELKKTYKIGLISNIASNWIRDTLLTDDEQKLFDKMVLSFEVGMTKPDPRIFKLAAVQLSVEPTEVIFIDDIETYCTAARGVGMRAIVYQDFAQLKRDLEAILAKS